MYYCTYRPWKITLADRLLEFTNTIQVTEGQMLDDMDLEKERGITIKSHAIQMEYTYKGEKYILNLIDTPGHVDFSYEVSRSIAACEGALLVVDASQGVQAQTISNLYMALEHDLEIIPVMNKCDMASAMPEEVEDEIIDLLGCEREDIIRASGKTGMGVEDILAAVIERVPHPVGDDQAPLQALIFDSVFNSFRGIIAYFKIENGVIRKGDKVKFFNTGKEYDADEIGVLKMDMMPRNELRTGDVGYIISGIKTSREVKVGDTITHIARPCEKAIAGFEEVKPMVFAGVYPIEAEDYENLRASLEKLQLNDASLTFQPESSLALGFGFRCGFLGLLHMEIVQERLDREFDMNVITTVPNVSYMVYDKQGHANEVHNPGGMPDPTLIDHIEEPYIDATVITATDYIGPIMTLCLGKRGELVRQNYVSGNRVEIHYRMPLGEIVIDFYDKLKSISKGYASFDYHQSGFRPSKLVKLDILGHDDPKVIRMLQDITGIDPLHIPFNDEKTLSLFSSPDALGITSEQLKAAVGDKGITVGAIGLPEFGTPFVRGMLEDTRPKNFSELVRISGFSHGTNVWLNNARDLITSGKVKLEEAISTRDDIMNYLIEHHVKPLTAFKVMENVRKGKGLEKGNSNNRKELEDARVPQWFIDSCLKISYLFPRAHAVAYVMMAFRIAWFKVYEPLAYYAAYFTIRAEGAFNAAVILRGLASQSAELARINSLPHPTAVEKGSATVIEAAAEMYLRGLKFLPIDLNKSSASEFLMEDGALRPPFNCIPALGNTVAKEIVEARREHPFTSKEDLKKRGKVSQSIIDTMDEMGILHGMPEEEQINLFSF